MTDQRRRRDRSWNAETIRRLRRHIGLTQAGLADELNTRQQTISEWERGAYRPRGPAARLLTRVAEDAAFPYDPNSAPNPTPSPTPNPPDEDDEETEDPYDDPGG